MQRTKIGWAFGLLLILAPAVAQAQFDSVPFVGIPAIGSWAEYQITTQSSKNRTVISQRVALIASDQHDGEEYLWFEVQTQSDDLGATRADLTYQMAVKRSEAEKATDIYEKVRDMIVQISGRPAFRIAPDFLQVGMQQGRLGGGSRGAGKSVDYAFRDLEEEALETDAGSIQCAHKKGLGEASVVLNMQTGQRAAVDSIVDMWYSKEIPFGLVRKVTKTTGKDSIDSETMTLRLESEEQMQLVAWGTGASGSVSGQIFEYDPSIADQLRPPTN